MIKNIFLTVLTLLSVKCQSYIGQIKILNNNSKSEVILYGDIHEGSKELNEKQANIAYKKIKEQFSNKKNIKFWFEGSVKEEIELLGINDSPHFLLLLEKSAKNHSKDLINIENRNFFAQLELLIFKLKANDTYVNQRIKDLKNYINKENLNETNIANFKHELNYLKSAQSYKSKNELIKVIKQKSKQAYNDLKIKFKRLLSKKIISKKLERKIKNEFIDLKKGLKRSYSLINQYSNSKSNISDLSSTITIATSTFFDINFVLEYLLQTKPKKLILFAGLAHMNKISEILKSAGFKVTYQNDLMFDKNKQEIAPIKNADFNYICA